MRPSFPGPFLACCNVTSISIIKMLALNRTAVSESHFEESYTTGTIIPHRPSPLGIRMPDLHALPEGERSAVNHDRV